MHLRRLRGGLYACIAASLVIPVMAILPNKRPPLQNYDRRAEKPDRVPAVAEASHQLAVARLAARVPRVNVTRDDITGTPKWIASPGAFLTGPKGQGKAVSEQALRGLEQDPHRAIKGFLNEHSGLFGQDASLLNNARIRREFLTPHSGMRTIVWEQHVDDIPVFEALLTGHLTKNEELVTLSSHFIPNAPEAANTGMGRKGPERARPGLSAREAVARAAAEIEVNVSTNDIAPNYGPASANVTLYTAPGLNENAEASLVWLPLDGTKLRLCWQIILTSRARGEMYRVLVDALNGAPLLRHCLTSYISDATYRVYTSDSPSPFSPGHPTPLTNQPPLVPRVLLTTKALNTNASPAGWINDGVNETLGNNVDAHLDRNNDNTPDLPRPAGAPTRVFDFAMDLTQGPTTYANAAVVQLFYWNNFMHDKLYELGFTEAAGNFQVNNFGRGGLGNDAVSADAQDGGGFNNANMSTPPDGSPARMQMYLFDGPAPDRDGDFDAEVVLHEYTHGLSNRRVGGGVGISALQSAGMGEGWSDFYAVALLGESGDNLHGNYAAGGYLTYQLSGLLQNYYFGIRRYPYSTDLSKNPLTFRDIDPTQASSHPSVPVNPVFGGSPPQEVHNQGEVWCVMLFEARVNFIEKHGFAVGNQLILRLVTDGMNLSPANPNFIEARDAIIQADLVLTGGANFYELWRAFAKRGMGFGATSPASSTTVGIRESFDVPDDLVVQPAGSLLIIGPVGGPFTPAGQTYSLTNVSTNSIVWSARTAATWLQISNTGGSLPPGAPAARVTVSLNSSVDLLPLGVYSGELTFSNHVSGAAQTRAVTLAVGQPDNFTEQFEGNNDLDFLTFTFTPDGSESYYSICKASASSFPADPRDGKTVTLTDDSSAMIHLAGGARVSLYGRSTNVFFIGSNGYITFDFGDSSLSESLSTHFGLPRISALLTDLNPGVGGTVSWQQATDRAVVTFLNIPLFGAVNNTNNFQIEMFFDGRIRITYLRVDHSGGVAGLSRGGGLPVSFQESDLSAYPACSAFLSLGFPATVTEGQGTVQGMVSLPVPPTTNVIVTLRSSNPAELSVPATVKIGAGETSVTFDATIVDDNRLDGSQPVMITALKPGYAPATAKVKVHDNEHTELAVNLPNLMEGTAGEGTLVTADNVSTDVVVPLFTDDPSLQLPAAVTIPAGSNSVPFTAVASDNSLIDGNRFAAITAHVDNWNGGRLRVQIIDNETTQLDVVLPGAVSEHAGTLAQLAWVALSGTLPTNLTVALSSSHPALVSVPPAVTIAAGQLSNRFNITITDDSVATGDRDVTITATAAGWVGDATLLVVSDDEFPPSPLQPFPLDLSSNNPVTVDLSWSGGEGELIVNGDFEIGDFTGWRQADQGAGSFQINNGSFDPVSPDGPLPPFAGGFSAVTDQSGPGRHELSQRVTLSGGAAFLQWAHRVRNHVPTFTNGQNFRVEVRDDTTNVLALAFSTQPGDPALQEWTQHSFDLTPLGARPVEIAFVQEDSLFYFNAHVDDVSLSVSSAQPTSYDVYFGTNAVLGPGNLLGTTTNLTWDLPPLAPLTTYYWQVVARRLGATPGPVWQFTTRGVDHFTWAPIASPQEINDPFTATIVAADELGRRVTNFTGSVSVFQLSQAGTNPVTPPIVSNFVDGAWSGALTIATPVSGARLLATDPDGHSGLSGLFDVVALDDVSLTMNANPNPVMVLRPMVLTLTAYNSGPATANSVIVNNTLFGSLSFASATTTQGSCSNSGGTIVCQLGSLGSGQSAVITINVTPTTAGLVTNTATISRIGPDGSDANNRVEQTISVVPAVALSIAQTATNEGPTTLALQIRINQPSTAPVSFEFRTESGSAAGGADFVMTNGTFTLPAGTTNGVLPVTILDDALDETNETFYLALTNVVNAAPQLTRYPLTIIDNDASPTVSIGDASLTEGDAGNAEARFPVQLSAASEAHITLNYNTSPGTALAGSDFILTNGLLNFPAGVTNAEIVVLVRSDLLDELDEAFSVNLFGATNVALLDSVGTGTIIDDDPLPSLRVLDANFVERNTTSTQFVTVELSAVSGLTVNVGYASSSGTAISGSDFVAAPGTLTFSPGTVTRTIPVNVLGDTNDEGNEYFSILLNNPLRASIGDGTAVVTLLNDDAPPGDADHFTWEVISNPQYLDGPFTATITARNFAGQPATNFAGPVSITATSQQAVAVVPNSSGPFVGGVWSGEISVLEPAMAVRLSASDSSGHTGQSNPFDVMATNDIALLMAANPTSVTVADTLHFLLIVTNTGPESATGVVLSNTLPPSVQFIAAIASQGTCSNAGNLIVCHFGTLPGSSSATVDLNVVPQMAHLLTNFASVHRTETDRYYPNNAASVVAQALSAPSINISNIVVIEPDIGSVVAVFGVFLSQPSSRAVSMEFATQTAEAGLEDFVPRSGLLIIPPGQTNAIVEVSVLGDLIDEPTESFALTLFNATNGVLASGIGYGQIQDQDPSPQLAVNDLTVAEGNPPDVSVATFTISLTRPSAFPVSAVIATQNGTGLAGADYVATNAVIVLPAGTTTANFAVKVVPDFLDENDETFSVTLSSATNATLADFRGVATIADDDSPPVILFSDVSILEGNSGSTTGAMTITLSQPSGRTVTVGYVMQDGTALQGSDYVSTSGTLTFTPGLTNRSISFQVLGDTSVEESEGFFIIFHSATNASLPNTAAVISIANDDGVAGALESFSWGPIGSPRRANAPFSATAFARDYFGDVATSFSSSVTLRARAGKPEIEIGSGAVPWHYPMAAFFHDARSQVIYLAGELQRQQRIGGLLLNISTPPGQALNAWTIRMKHTTRSNYVGAALWESTGWTVVYQRNTAISRSGWIEFPFTTVFDYNGSNHLLIDFTFNNTSYTFDGDCLSTLTGQPRALTFRSDSSNGDPLTWSASSPLPVISSRIPNIRLQPVTAAVPITPGTIGPFMSGMWSGNVTVQVPGTNVQLIAEDSLGHLGFSERFEVRPANTPVMLRIARSGATLQLTWESIVGQSYRVEFNEGLEDNEWQPLTGTITAAGPVAMASDSTDESGQRFYRVIELAP
jgi:uncharacterized repeat protein (TIGR01451 family)